METLRLRPDGARRAARGHLWIFSNELDRPDPGLIPGDDVRVVDAQGRLVGSGTYNPASLIAVRLHAPGREAPLDAAFLADGVRRAKALREKLLGSAATACRVVYAEGDGLPGWIADRFGDVLSVQLLTAATDRRSEWILDALEDTYAPSGILLRNDVRARQEEGLVREVRVGRGQVPALAPFSLHGLSLSADLHTGQKTGFFFDQRENYSLLAAVAQGAEVLDAFCYSGAWGLHALKRGAARVTFCDVSEAALSLARRHAEANFGAGGPFDFAVSDALDHLRAQPGRYDLVILDPPAYAKSRKKLHEALRGYLNLNKWGMRAVKPGGFLVTCSCSHHVSPDAFTEAIALAAREAGRRVRILGSGRQAPDHPWHPAMPETAYLKALLLQVS